MNLCILDKLSKNLFDSLKVIYNTFHISPPTLLIQFFLNKILVQKIFHFRFKNPEVNSRAIIQEIV